MHFFFIHSTDWKLPMLRGADCTIFSCSLKRICSLDFVFTFMSKWVLTTGMIMVIIISNSIDDDYNNDNNNNMFIIMVSGGTSLLCFVLHFYVILLMKYLFSHHLPNTSKGCLWFAKQNGCQTTAQWKAMGLTQKQVGILIRHTFN